MTTLCILFYDREFTYEILSKNTIKIQINNPKLYAMAMPSWLIVFKSKSIGQLGPKTTTTTTHSIKLPQNVCRCIKIKNKNNNPTQSEVFQLTVMLWKIWLNAEYELWNIETVRCLVWIHSKLVPFMSRNSFSCHFVILLRLLLSN